MYINIGELDESGCGGNLSGLISGDAIAKDGTMVVPANKDLFVGVLSNLGNASCKVGAIVQFGKDKNYELNFRIGLYDASRVTCVMTIDERTIAGELVSTRLYEYEDHGVSFDKVCKVEGDIDTKLVSCFDAATFPFSDTSSCAPRPIPTMQRPSDQVIKCIPDVGCTYE